MKLNESRFYKPLLLLLALGLLGSVFLSERRLNTQRRALGLTRLDPLQNAPPLLAITTVVLGGFRGLIANALWIRAMEMQEEDKYFEMVQLADWITKLQPNLSAVWIVQAWNMSWNISIKFSDPRDRWNWVLRGIELLRDEGLKYNPHSVDIHRELAWHFQNKMGHNLDDAHLYYKNVWATEMQQVLGGGRPKWDELINPQTEEARARAKLLREKYKLDPALMKEVDDTYGPLEWRLPESHAIYWAVAGIKQATTKDDLIKLRRVIYQSLALAFHRGELLRNKDNSVEFGPNLAIADRANAAFEQARAEDPVNRDHIGNGHKNFLLDAIYFNYVHNRIAESERWLKKLKEQYPNAFPKDTTIEEYAIKTRLQDDSDETDQNRLTAHITGLLTQSYVNLARDREDEALGYAGLAKNLWRLYMDKATKHKATHRIRLAELDQMKRDVVRRLLDPDTGLVPELAGALRTKVPEMAAEADALNRAAAAAAVSTNAPPVSTNAPPAPELVPATK